MTENSKTTKLTVPLSEDDRERFRVRSHEIGMSPATYARVLIKRELNTTEPVAA